MLGSDFIGSMQNATTFKIVVTCPICNQKILLHEALWVTSTEYTKDITEILTNCECNNCLRRISFIGNEYKKGKQNERQKD